MIVKKVYEGYAILGDKDLWFLHIMLMRRKNYYFEAFAKHAVDNTYRYALYGANGNLLQSPNTLSFDLKQAFAQIFHQQRENFRKEIIMDIDKNIEKIIRNQAHELGELLKAHNTKEAWTRAGELNAMLKKEDAQQVAPELCDQLRQELRGYYYVNGELNKLHKQLYAKGNKLIDLSNH